jgi:hypothetical protein
VIQRRRVWTLLIGALLLYVATGPPSRATEPVRLNLHQRIARSELVVHVKIREGALKYALVDVIETFKGTLPAEELRIAFRDFNLSRGWEVEPIVFPDGQEEILFLLPYRYAGKKEKNRDLFELLRGGEGRITVPAEGALALIDAVRLLSGLAGEDPATQVKEFEGQIDSRNTYLAETALDELLRLQAASPEIYGDLIPLLTSPSPGIRSRGLRLMEQIFSSIRHDPMGESPDQAEFALAAVIERARNDEKTEVRVLAVRTMAAWPDLGKIEAELRAIADQDRSQDVRYEAERVLYRGALRRP